MLKEQQGAAVEKAFAVVFCVHKTSTLLQCCLSNEQQTAVTWPPEALGYTLEGRAVNVF